MATRRPYTLYQYNDFVRLGVNTLFGGTIFELYGTDGQNRIQQNSGGAVQMSIWGGPANGADGYTGTNAWFAVSGTSTCSPQGYNTWQECVAANPNPSCNGNDAPNFGTNPSACCGFGATGWNVSNCSTEFACGDSGWMAAGPLNPIQAKSGNCTAGTLPGQPGSGSVSSVNATAAGGIIVTKNEPYNYTKSSAVAGLVWSQESRVVGPAAAITYNIQYNGTYTMGNSGQEVPAIFTHGGVGTTVFYYTGSAPYVNDQSQVSYYDNSVTQTPIDFVLPGKTVMNPNDGNPQVNLSESWVTLCDSQHANCLTLASFAGIGSQFSYGFPDGPGQASPNLYVGLQTSFAITPGMNSASTLYMFPYRFDHVIAGKTVRKWIYDLKANPLLRNPVSQESFIGNIDGIQQGNQLSGWACQTHSAHSVLVNVYAGDPSAGGKLVASGVANNPSEPGIGQVCNSTGNNLRFSIPIPATYLQNYSGPPLFITETPENILISQIYPPQGFYMNPTSVLKVGAQQLSLQTNGNLVMSDSTGATLWSSSPMSNQSCPGPATNNNSCFSFFQSNGQLASYSSHPGGDQNLIWATQSGGTNSFLVVSPTSPYLKVIGLSAGVVWQSN